MATNEDNAMKRGSFIKTLAAVTLPSDPGFLSEVLSGIPLWKGKPLARLTGFLLGFVRSKSK
jgi:hypothetical protein